MPVSSLPRRIARRIRRPSRSPRPAPVAQPRARAGGRRRRDLGYLFVVTYGRSGSTLLQGMLNSIPGYLIRGENHQALRHLHAYHQVTVRQRRKVRRVQRRRDQPPGTTTSTHPFYGMDGVPVQGSLRAIRRLALDTLLRPEPDTRVVGFKEIRWDRDDLADYVGWLRQVFPGARFVVNTRDLGAVSQSKWWANDPGARAALEKVEARLLALADSLGDDAFHVRYDDYVADLGRLRPLFAWLGEEYDEEALRAVLELPHSY